MIPHFSKNILGGGHKFFEFACCFRNLAVCCLDVHGDTRDGDTGGVGCSAAPVPGM